MLVKVLPGGFVEIPSFRSILSAASVENPLIAISGGGDTDIVANTTKPFLFCYQLITVAAGSYTRNFTLNQQNAIKNSEMTLAFEIAAGTDASLLLPIYNHTVTPPAMETLIGRPDASYYLLKFRNTGTNWEKLITLTL